MSQKDTLIHIIHSITDADFLKIEPELSKILSSVTCSKARLHPRHDERISFNPQELACLYNIQQLTFAKLIKIWKKHSSLCLNRENVSKVLSQSNYSVDKIQRLLVVIPAKMKSFAEAGSKPFFFPSQKIDYNQMSYCCTSDSFEKAPSVPSTDVKRRTRSRKVVDQHVLLDKIVAASKSIQFITKSKDDGRPLPIFGNEYLTQKEIEDRTRLHPPTTNCVPVTTGIVGMNIACNASTCDDRVDVPTPRLPPAKCSPESYAITNGYLTNPFTKVPKTFVASTLITSTASQTTTDATDASVQTIPTQVDCSTQTSPIDMKVVYHLLSDWRKPLSKEEIRRRQTFKELPFFMSSPGRCRRGRHMEYAIQSVLRVSH